MVAQFSHIAERQSPHTQVSARWGPELIPVPNSLCHLHSLGHLPCMVAGCDLDISEGRSLGTLVSVACLRLSGSARHGQNAFQPTTRGSNACSSSVEWGWPKAPRRCKVELEDGGIEGRGGSQNLLCFSAHGAFGLDGT